jgi:phosphate transport system protein
MPSHTVASFDADLKTLDALTTDMGERAKRSLVDVAKALLERDARLAQQVIAADRAIDALQHTAW